MMKRSVSTLLYTKNSKKALPVGMLAATIVATLMACDTATVFDAYVATPVAGWDRNDTLTFSVPAVRAAATYGEHIGVRATNDYPFKSINLIVEQKVLPADVTVSDTVRCDITDDYGNFRGSGVSTYQYEVPLKNVRLHKGDSLQISIRHNMKREVIPGISDVGVRISASSLR